MSPKTKPSLLKRCISKDGLTRGCAGRLFFQVFREKVYRPLPGVGGIGGAIAGLVIGILEGVAGVVVNLDLDLLVQLFHRGLEFMHIVGRDSLILAAERSE